MNKVESKYKNPEKYVFGLFENSVDCLVPKTLLLSAQMFKVAGDIPRARKIVADVLRSLRRLKREGKYDS